MLGNNQVVRNRKPRSEGRSQLQGRQEDEDANSNYAAETELKASRSSYDKGAELYRRLKVFITNCLSKGNGYELDLRTPVKRQSPDIEQGNKSANISTM